MLKLTPTQLSYQHFNVVPWACAEMKFAHDCARDRFPIGVNIRVPIAFSISRENRQV